MAIRNWGHLAQAERDQSFFTSFKKAGVALPTSGLWFDMSMVGGTPSANYYASNPITSKAMSYSDQKGFYHGPSFTDKNKYLFETNIFSNSTTLWANHSFIICDYLMYYPFIDEGETALQTMIQQDSLTRYSNGEGVKLMIVSQGARIGGGIVRITYKNSQGVSGRVAPDFYLNSLATINGTICSTGNASTSSIVPFIPIRDDDTGVQLIESVEMIAPDSGIFAIVLVKPLSSATTQSALNISVKEHISDNGMMLSEIKNDAYINFITLSAGTVTSAAYLAGHLSTVVI